MGMYEDRVVPRMIDFCCGMKSLAPLRQRACAGLTGKVVEIGFGSGLNVPHYPAAVTSVEAIEPADLGWKLARKRVAASSTPVHRSGLDGQQLPFEDDRFDAALSTYTMCTIPDAAAALAEVRRVLKPGGKLHFIEHGLAPHEGVRRWQRRIEPVQRRIFGGCRLTRPVRGILDAAGFQEIDIDEFYAQGPKPVSAFSLGTAVSA
jgi:ubiquinone/menaquinone biosynthesis C-methylase UbiE